MTARALRFGAVAEAYERFRPGYPSEIVDLVASFARRPVRTALEIGAGTGKATRVFAERGVAVTATDPDPAMLRELRRQVPGVTTVEARFEDLEVGERFDLVYAAAAMHWTHAEGRWDRVASFLRPGGVFANVGGPLRVADPAVEAAVRAAREPFLASDDVPSPDGTPADHELQWPGTELAGSPWFEEVEQSVIPRRFAVEASEFVGYLSTVSAYLELSASTREAVWREILAVLPTRVDIAADLVVHLARRRDD